ncbi:unnamed protein product, partial [Allacma fusca]
MRENGNNFSTQTDEEAAALPLVTTAALDHNTRRIKCRENERELVGADEANKLDASSNHSGEIYPESGLRPDRSEEEV